MTLTTSHKPILLLGAYGRGNAGDDVFILSAAALFRDRILYINSADDSLLPTQVKGQIKTISTVNAWDLLTKIKLFLTIREVVYWGGDLWVKLYGTRAPRRLLYKMVFTNALLRASGKQVHYIGCGIGDLHGYSRWLARLSAQMAKTVVVREQRSSRVLNLEKLQVMPDLAINLPYHQTVLHTMPINQPFSIVISVLWSVPDPAHNFSRLIEHIARFVDKLPPKDFKITLLPMHITGEVHDDLWASEQLIQRIKKHTVDMYIARDLPAIIECLAKSNLVIGGRLHANILATLNATPCIGISYRPKVRSFFADNKLDKYCLELDEVDRLPDLFRSMYNNYTAVSEAFYQVSEHNLSKRSEYATLIREL